MLLNLNNLLNMRYAWIYSSKGQYMQTCTEKVSIFGVVKSWNEYLQSLRSVTSLYKNLHLHGNPGSSDHLNAGATSETTRTLKTIHVTHWHINSNKVDMRRMMIFGDLVGLTLPDICLTGEEKPHPGNLPRAWNDPGPAAWPTRMLPPAPQL